MTLKSLIFALSLAAQSLAYGGEVLSPSRKTVQFFTLLVSLHAMLIHSVTSTERLVLPPLLRVAPRYQITSLPTRPPTYKLSLPKPIQLTILDYAISTFVKATR